MPVVILGTQMGRGVKWRPLTTGLDGQGPADATLVIKFDGDPRELPGFDGRTLDIALFREACSLAEQSWIPESGVFQCTIVVGFPPAIQVRFA